MPIYLSKLNASTGFSGYSGFSGFSGFSGYSGVSGFSGYSGVSGFSGTSGYSGIQGIQGIQGVYGATGSQGTTGISGFSGATSYDADTLDGQHGSYYQPVSTAITTSNIGSQSVNYASSAGNADTLDGNHASTFATATNLSSHTSNTSNPHSVTAAQVGLGNVTNESKATMFSSPTFTGNVLPSVNAAYDLGSSTLAWRNMYTNDLHLSNEGHEEGNSVDGTKGNWTIQEGTEDLFIINNKNGKKYKFKLEEI